MTYRIDPHELLKEHEHDSNHGPSDHSGFEHVHPARDFELCLASKRVSL